MANSEGLLTQLSGGNQQKVILARWLSMNCKLLILDEPTRGIDVLAKEEIHHLIRECADQGMTVLVVSSEMEELIQICNRILIMHEGYQKGIVEAKEITAENILKMALE
jgi:ABC-type sugar transport system ATPase subunit